MSTFISLILCISASINTVNMHTISMVAREHGYRVSRLNDRESASASYAWAPKRCALTVLPSTADHVGIYFLYYDKTEYLSPTKVDRMLKQWENWL